MASLLQGFEEVQLVKPVGKTVLTVTDSAIRFNKATALIRKAEAALQNYDRVIDHHSDAEDQTRQGDDV